MLYARGIGLSADPANLQSLDVRFSSPIYPGETIRTELWIDGKVVSFRARAVGRAEFKETLMN